MPKPIAMVLELAIVSGLLLAFAAHAVEAKLQTPDPTGEGGPAGQPYVDPLVAMGGTPPYTWTALDRLPAWESLSSDGVLTGLPMKPSTTEFRVQWTDANGATHAFPLDQTVTPAEPVTVNARPLLVAPGQAVSVTTTVRDANGNPVPYAEVRFYASGSASITGPNGGAPPATADASGNAAARVTDTQAEDVEITAESGGVTGSTDVAFATDATRPTFMVIDAETIFDASTTAPSWLRPAGAVAALLPADGVSKAVIGVRVLDQNGKSLPGVPVSFQTTLGHLSSTTGTTAAQGQVTVDLTSTEAGTAEVTATVPGVPRINAASHNRVEEIEFVAPGGSSTGITTPWWVAVLAGIGGLVLGAGVVALVRFRSRTQRVEVPPQNPS